VIRCFGNLLLNLVTTLFALQYACHTSRWQNFLAGTELSHVSRVNWHLSVFFKQMKMLHSNLIFRLSSATNNGRIVIRSVLLCRNYADIARFVSSSRASLLSECHMQFLVVQVAIYTCERMLSIRSMVRMHYSYKITILLRLLYVYTPWCRCQPFYLRITS